MSRTQWIRGLCFLVVAGCSDSDPKESEPAGSADKEVGPVAAEPTTPPIGEGAFPGVVVARRAVDVVSKNAGRVRRVPVVLGQKVSQGQLLVRLEAGDLKKQVTAARAAARAAEFAASKAKLEATSAEERLARRQSLKASFSAEELRLLEIERDKAKADAGLASAQLTRAWADHARLDQALRDMDLLAPFAGRLAALHAVEGAWLEPGISIGRVISSDDLWLRFAVPEAVAARLAVGARVGVEADEVEGKLVAVVRHTAPEVDAASQLVMVEAQLDAKQDDSVRAGMAARVRILEPMSQRGPSTKP